MYDADGQPTVDENGELVVGLLPSQIEVLTWEHEWGAVRGGKGAGKTIGLCLWMLQRLELYPKAAHFVVGADFEQLRRGFFQSFIDTLTSIGWEEGVDFRYRESPSPMIVILATGARLRSLGAIQANRIESVEFQTLLLEEPQTWKNGEAIYGILNTRMRHSKRSAAEYGHDEPDRPALKMQARMSFNPPLVGSWIHNVVENLWKPAGYPCLRVSVRDNYLMLDVDAYIHRLETALPPIQWPSQIDGHWSTTGGGAIREFDALIHGDPPEPIPRGIDPNKPLIWSLDFNIGHQRSVIAQTYTQPMLYGGVEIRSGRPPEHKYTRTLPAWQRYVLRYVGEIAINEVGTLEVVQRFIDIYGDQARQYGLVLYGDSSGGNRSQVDLATNWSTIMRELDRASIGYDYRVTHNGPVVDRVTEFDARFRNGDGFGATVDVAECPELVLDILQVKMTPDGKNIEKNVDKRRSHSFDAASYAAVGFAKTVALARLHDLEKKKRRDGRNFFAR